ncbi:TPA: AraC family ligand binding domain-containing protein [Raoultella planticola]
MKPHIHYVQQHRLTLPGLEAMTLQTERPFSRHSHDQFGLGIFTHGAQRSWSHIGQVDAAAGNMIMVNPGEIHDGAPLLGPRSWQMVYIEPQIVTAEFEDGIRAEEILLRPVVEDPHLRQLMLRLFREITALSADETAIEEAPLLCLLRAPHCHHVTRPVENAFLPPSHGQKPISIRSR